MSASVSEPSVSVAPAVVPLPSGTSSPASHSFEQKLQHLVSDFWTGRSDDADSTLQGLQRQFISLARELGRVDGVARIFGVPREETLNLLRSAYVEGKRAALVQHQRAAEDCRCEPAEVLLREIESH